MRTNFHESKTRIVLGTACCGARAVRFHPRNAFVATREHSWAFVFTVFHRAPLAITLPSSNLARGDRTLLRPHSDYSSAHRGLLLQDWYLIPPNADLSASGPDFSRPARDREHTARGLSPRDSALLHP